MRSNKSNGNRWSRYAKRIVPPAATIILSVAILTSAVWIRRQENAHPTPPPSGLPIWPGQSSASTLPIGASQTTSPSDANGKSSSTSTAPSKNGDSGKAPNSTGASSSGTTNASGTSPSKSSSPGASHASGNSTASAGSPPAVDKPSTGSGDVGFAPVTGGSVEPLQVNPVGSSNARSVVTEFGPHPTTTWTAPSVTGPNHAKLLLQSQVSPSSMLVLPLTKGVLWANIPKTVVGSNGVLGPSDAPTTLEYTPFPTSGNAALTHQAQTLGVIPPSVNATVSSGATPPVTWYQPQPASASSGGTSSSVANLASQQADATNPAGNASINPSASTSGESTSGTSGAASATAGNNTQNTSASPTSNGNVSGASSHSSTSGSSSSTSATSSAAVASGTLLYLAGLYQVSGGAVIELRADQSATPANVGTWLYYWNKDTRTLTPITALTNGNGHYAWFAVGSHLVYFGSRSVLPPSLTRFTGQQFAFDIRTLKAARIRLGTWTSDAYTEGDTLIFEIKNATSWAKFTPNGL